MINTILSFFAISEAMMIIVIMIPVLLIYLFVKLVIVSYSTRNAMREMVEKQQTQNELLKEIAEHLKSN